MFRSHLITGLAMAALLGSVPRSWAQAPQGADLPDLIPWIESAEPFVTIQSFSADSCAVQEGAIQEGTHALLRFATETRNVGTADLVIGDPSDNPLFHFEECHGHHHFTEYADYRLLGPGGEQVAGHKAGFCLLDSFRHDPTANPDRVYGCSFQGIQAGWADIYGASLDGQWIEITDLPDGMYTLEIEINPEGLIEESDHSNNTASMPVMISGGTFQPPANDLCEDATAVGVGSFTGSSLYADADGSESCGDESGASVWFSHTPVSSGPLTIGTDGSDFDTVLSVHSACPGTVSNEIICNDDSGGTLQSMVTFDAVGQITYLIRLAGYDGASGSYRLTITGADSTRYDLNLDGKVDAGDVTTLINHITGVAP